MPTCIHVYVCMLVCLGMYYIWIYTGIYIYIFMYMYAYVCFPHMHVCI